MKKAKSQGSWPNYDFSAQSCGNTVVGELRFSTPCVPGTATVFAIHKAEFLAGCLGLEWDVDNLEITLCPTI